MKKRLFIPSLALLMVACGNPEADQAENQTVSHPGESTSSTEVLPLVEVEKSELGSFEHYVEVQGSVEADKNVLLRAEMNGILRKLKVEEGARVRKGQVLAEVDDVVIRTSIDEVKKGLELAEFVFEKQENLRKENVGSELQYKQAKNQKESLEKKLSSLYTQLEKAKVKAPFDGFVDEIFPKEGEMTGPQMPLLRIMNLKKVKISAEISESYLASVRKGSKVKVQFPALNKTVEDIEISQTGKFINHMNRTFKVHMDLDNPGEEILPNLLARIWIRDFEADSVVMVPSESILQDKDGNDYVFIMKNGKAMKTSVVKGKEYDKKTHILENLDADVDVITRGARGINDGDQVKRMPAKK